MNLDRFKTLNIKPLIAKNPAVPRDSSKLMVLHRNSGKIEHCVFRDIVNYFNAGDCLVLNNSKVFPAKLPAKKSTGGKTEILLVRPCDTSKSASVSPDVATSRWLCLTPQCRAGLEIILQGGVKATAIGKSEDGYWIFEFTTGNILSYADKYGVMPLPPYIEKARKKSGDEIFSQSDGKNYQTVYAGVTGSIAAPTAGFHFTDELIEAIKQKGVKVAFVTLHVGWGTFRPVKTAPQKHQMLAEFAEISAQNADIINDVKKSGGKIFSTGTTATRTLEGFADENCRVTSGKKWVDLFIYPPYKFKIIDFLITNFHVPGHTPICLTQALAGEEFLFKAYKQAVEKKYRFYSFGDAMLIL
ncbi:MAG TPA: tRNA preQ1(34) S-adenosylmethionine ribosyltransferase-isomerase QueA [Elusimicrobiales bacterium]|nr:tRNA preQ1(34) S-adenosylmethionine ribosyltransferase-isomerase QueA [Elusimicrobiales bacterium]